MGIYFDYDFDNGKEVENYLPCYLCRQKKVLVVEYHVKNGPIYMLYNDARKVFSGREIHLGSSRYLVCEDCYRERGSEEDVIAEILEQRREAGASLTVEYDAIKVLEEEIYETKAQIAELIEKIGELHERLERERARRQTSQQGS